MPVLPREIVTGAQFDEALARLIERHRWSRVAVITGDRVEHATRFTARLQAATAATITRWGRASGHGAAEWVESVVGSVRAFDPDVLVTAGGGSCHDSGKGIAALLARGGRVEDHCIRYQPGTGIDFPDLSGPKVPLVTVPSTLSGSEGNGAAGFTRAPGHGKRVLADPSLVAAAVVLDPAFARTGDGKVLLGSATNALNHCIEGMASRRPDTAADVVFSASLTVFGDPALDERGMPAEQWLARALASSVLTGAVMAGTWLGIAHAVGHVLGATYGVPHGACHAVMAGACIRFNADVAGAAHARAAAVLGLDGGSHSLADWMDSRAEKWGLPRRLGDLGVRSEHLPDLAAAIWRDHDTYYNARRPEGPEEIVTLLREAL